MNVPFEFCDAGKTLIDLLKQAMAQHQTPLDGWSLADRDPQAIAQLLPILDWFYRNYFRVKTSGWEQIPKQEKVLLIGSHNGGLLSPDLYMMMRDWYQHFGVERPIYALMNPLIWRAMPGPARFATQLGAIQAHPKMAIAALEHNASLLIYPGGAQDVFRPYSDRHKIHLHGRHGFIKLALLTQTRIIPLVSHGAHSTLIVLADIYPQLQRLHALGLPWPFGTDPEVCPIYLGLPWGLAIGPLPNLPFPVQIHTRVCAPIEFERYGETAAQDVAYVDACYRRVETQMQQELDQLVQAVSQH